MPDFTCPRCGYVASQICHYKNHLNKKKICEGTVSLAEEYKKYNIDVFERCDILFKELIKTREFVKHTQQEQYVSGDHNTFNNCFNNINVNILPYDETRMLTSEEITNIVDNIVEYNRHLIENDMSTDGEYMVAFMTKAIEHKMKKNNNIRFGKVGRKNYVFFKTKDGQERTELIDGVTKLCSDIEQDYIQNIEEQRFIPNSKDSDKEADARRTKFAIDKEIRRPEEKRDEYKKAVVQNFKN